MWFNIEVKINKRKKCWATQPAILICVTIPFFLYFLKYFEKDTYLLITIERQRKSFLFERIGENEAQVESVEYNAIEYTKLIHTQRFVFCS